MGIRVTADEVIFLQAEGKGFTRCCRFYKLVMAIKGEYLLLKILLKK